MQTSSAASIKSRLPDYFLLALLVFILLQIGRLLLPFSGAILGSFVIGIVFYPLYLQLGKYLPKRSPATQAVIADIVVLLFIIVPLVLLVWIIANEAQSLSPSLKQWRNTVHDFREGGVDAVAPVRSLRQWLGSNFGIEPAQFTQKLGAGADKLVEGISNGAAAMAKNSVGVLVNLVVMAFTLFFVFRDGPKIVRTFESYIPLRNDIKGELNQRIQGTVVGVLRGMFLTSLAQGLTASVGYLIAGVPAVALLGFLTAMAGLIPSIGTGLIWVPIGLAFLLKHSFIKGIFILAWGVLVVGILDNFLRPYLMKDQTELPFLALFFALLGGIQVWGMQGIILGPLLMSILPVLLDAYRARFISAADIPAQK